MKKKFLFAGLFATVMAGMVFTSCSDDDGSNGGGSKTRKLCNRRNGRGIGKLDQRIADCR